jgi:hypothetical protein
MRNELNQMIDDLFCLEAEMALVEALLRQHVQRAEKRGDVATLHRMQNALVPGLA